MAHPHGPLTILIPILLLVPLLYFRMRRLSKPRPLKLGRLWLRPALFLLLAGLALTAARQGHHVTLTPTDWAVLIAAAGAGAVAGWVWGRTMAIEVHAQDGTLMVKGGQAAMLVLVILIFLRMGLRYGAEAEAAAWHLKAVLIADASILFSALLFAVRSLEMFLRARRILAGRARS